VYPKEYFKEYALEYFKEYALALSNIHMQISLLP